MAAPKKLSNIVEGERKRIAMVPGRISLRPKSTRTVQLANGQFATIDVEPLFYECEGERRSAAAGPLLDPNIPRDKEILDAFEELLVNKPWMARDVRYKIEIIGEFDEKMPWQGYDEQTADAMRETYLHMPDAAKPDLESVMKYELNRTVYDEDLDDEVSATDDEKVKVLNELYREEQKRGKVMAADTVEI